MHSIQDILTTVGNKIEDGYQFRERLKTLSERQRNDIFAAWDFQEKIKALPKGQVSTPRGHVFPSKSTPQPKCRGCQAEITWVQNKSGSWCPCRPGTTNRHQCDDKEVIYFR